MFPGLLEILVETQELLVVTEHSEHVARKDAGVFRRQRHIVISPLDAGHADTIVAAQSRVLESVSYKGGGEINLYKRLVEVVDNIIVFTEALVLAHVESGTS